MGASVLVRERSSTGNPSVPTGDMRSAPRNPITGTAYETATLRGVRCVRLSVLTDETTSPERQQGKATAAGRKDR